MIKVSMRGAPRRTALALAIGLGFAGMAFGQATTGGIYGQVPAGSGESVLVKSATGVTRTAPVDAAGNYAITQLPLGTYTVTLQHDGQAVDSRSDVTLRVGASTEVSFAGANAANAKELGGLTVTANALPSIDVTSVDSRTVITSQELARLPIARSAEAIALLAPGVVAGSSLFVGTGGGSVVTFAGSSATENAYYINGFNTTDPLSSLGGLTLPYGAIDQQEILSGGYGAAYGRSDGGVLNQVGKRGTNEWHFGIQAQWTPKFLKSDPRNYYYVTGSRAGQIRQYRNGNKLSNTVISAYGGGPLIKDRLFFFAAVEGQREEGPVVGSVAAPYKVQERFDEPKWYAKLDWNINDSNILELTGASSKESYSASEYDFDYKTRTEGAFNSYDTSHKLGSDLYSGKFTSYITDDLTLTALYGQMKGTYYYITPGYDATFPYLFNPEKQNPALTGGGQITNSQTLDSLVNPAHSSKDTNLRIDLTYRMGDHTVTAGIDNQRVSDLDDSTITSGPGYAWQYGNGNPNSYIIGGPVANGPNWMAQPYVDAPGAYAGGSTGYFVNRYIYGNGSSVTTTQKAQYIEDSWQVSDRFLLKLGLRNDQFTNYNGDGIPYLRLTSPQLAPRLGFSWDVNGDSSFKVYGNAGRYYLALPSTVALRAAGASLFTNEYFTYTGIDQNGIPTGLTPIKNSRNGPISSNLEYGTPRDPKTAAATNLKSEFQDEYILGFDKKLNDSLTFGVKATYRDLRNAIDDVGDSFAIQDKMTAMGIDPATVGNIFGSYLFNPGRTNVFQIAKADGSGYYAVPMTNQDFHFNTTLKRHYYGVDFFLEHAFDGKWFGKVDYLYSKSYGNSEGQVRSDIGQTDVSATVDWDYAQVMDYANGNLANDRRHQIKAYGSYQLTPEFLVSANVAVMSGAPKTCLSYYGANETNPGLGYNGGYYHFCNRVPSSPGAQHQPWTYLLSVGAEYRPEWGGKKLAFNVFVNNILNKQQITQTYALHGFVANPNTSYGRPYSSQTPRYVRFGISYDF